MLEKAKQALRGHRKIDLVSVIITVIIIISIFYMEPTTFLAVTGWTAALVNLLISMMTEKQYQKNKKQLERFMK